MSGDVHVRFCERPGVRLPRATDLVILVDWHRRHDWLVRAVHRRLREELAKLDLRLNENKSRIVDLRQGETFGFLGFDFRRVRSVRGVWRAQVTPKLTQRTALLGKLRDVFGRSQSQPVGRVIAEINPILRGWVNYFRIGNASRCLAYVRLWVEQRVRRHLMIGLVVGAPPKGRPASAVRPKSYRYP